MHIQQPRGTHNSVCLHPHPDTRCSPFKLSILQNSEDVSRKRRYIIDYMRIIMSEYDRSGKKPYISIYIN